MRRRTKRLIIIISVILVVIAAGAAVFQYYVRPRVVDFAFGKVMGEVMGVWKSAETSEQPASDSDEEVNNSLNEGETSATADTEGAADDGTKTQKTQREQEVENMSVGEIASVISSSSVLTSKLESIVSQSDKERVLAMLMSNFTSEEISMYAKEVAAGITPARRSQLASIAKSRLTSAQWSECLGLLSKYVNQLRPIIAEYTN